MTSESSKQEIIKTGLIIKQELEKGCIETKLSKISASLIGKKVKFKALVVGESVGKAFERKVIVICRLCKDRLNEIDLSEERNFSVLYEKLNTGKIDPYSIGFAASGCSVAKNGLHQPIMEFLSEELQDYSLLFIKELPEEIEAFSQEEYSSLASRIWKLYFLGISKEAKRVEVVAYVVKNPRTDEIEFISSEINPLEDEFSAIKITKEDHQRFLEYFGDCKKFDVIVENQIAPHIVGRNFAKLSALLTLHSPYEVFDIFNSRKIRGCIRTLWSGDTKTGKTEMGKDMTYAHYKIGEMVFGETASRAGLTYVIDTDNRTIVWGVLPLNDRKFVFIDGIHSIHSEEIEQLREVLEQQAVRVARSVSGERLARVRIIATLNPNHPPMKNYYYKIQSLIDTSVFKDPVDLTRWDIVVPFTLEDVDGEMIANARPRERPIPFDVFRKHIFWTWSLSPEQIRYSEDAKDVIVKYTKELFKWVSSDYPLIHAGIRDHLTRISVAFACLKHSVVFDNDENFAYVEVKKEHVEDAKNFIEEMITKIDYDAFIYRVKDQTDLSDDEYNTIREALDEIEINILRELTNGPKKSPELASIIGLSDRSIRQHYEPLRKYNLIETSQGFGVRITTKGILLLKKLDRPKEEKKFTKLEESYFGKCAYCGEEKYLMYKDDSGSHLCEECYKEESG
jgi:DNA replicative helicase MCM subunit Mcm2 (Cdc46/Mcm family)